MLVFEIKGTELTLTIYSENILYCQVLVSGNIAIMPEYGEK